MKLSVALVVLTEKDRNVTKLGGEVTPALARKAMEKAARKFFDAR